MSYIILLAIIVFALIIKMVYSHTIERYSQTNYEQQPNLASYPQSIGNEYILNYQYLFPKRVTSINDKGTCK